MSHWNTIELVAVHAFWMLIVGVVAVSTLRISKTLSDIHKLLQLTVCSNDNEKTSTLEVE